MKPEDLQPVFSLYANNKLIQQGYNLNAIFEHIKKIAGNCILDGVNIPPFRIENEEEPRQHGKQNKIIE